MAVYILTNIGEGDYGGPSGAPLTLDNILKISEGDYGGGTDYISSNSIKLVADAFERAALTGDVIADQDSNVTTIAPGAVTDSKINSVSWSKVSDAPSFVVQEAGKGLSQENYTTTEKNKLASLHNYDDTAITSALADKVDKIPGKGLSEQDYTLTEKNKLSGIEAGANKNVQADWNQTNSAADDFIKNKPPGFTNTNIANTDLIFPADGVRNLQVNGSRLTFLKAHTVSFVDHTSWGPPAPGQTGFYLKQGGNGVVRLKTDKLTAQRLQRFQDYEGELEVLQTGAPSVSAIDGSTATLVYGTQKYGTVEYTLQTEVSEEIYIMVEYDVPFENGSVAVCSFHYPDNNTFLTGNAMEHVVVPLAPTDPTLKTGFAVVFRVSSLPPIPPLHIRYLVNGH